MINDIIANNLIIIIIMINDIIVNNLKFATIIAKITSYSSSLP